jgi:IS605 OrfB family transposase
MRTAYNCRAYPDPEQAGALNRTFGCVRVAWNRTLAWRQARYRDDRAPTSYAQASAYLTAMKATEELGWLNEVSSVPLQQALRHQQTAFTGFFAGRASCPRYKVRASRADFLHRTSTRLVRDHDVIVIEDLNVSGMVRNRSLAKAISDCGWGTFRRLLEYKAARAGRHLIVIDRFYPSSKTCSECGHLLADLSLSTRAWHCPSCGTRHDRDVNAAKNILAAGLAVSACGADVRHSGSSWVRSAVKQEPRPVRVGIPVLIGGE